MTIEGSAWDMIKLKDMIKLEQLIIAEFESHSQACASHLNLENTVQIHTCQRSIILSTNALALLGARRQFSGLEAYEFLLRFACGLESEIKGETDVFGQVKSVFKKMNQETPHLAAEWNHVFLKIFEDTKDIRAQYLQGIGGNTYGTLSRRLLNPTADDQVLILGAGQISKSVAPYFAEFNLKIWNRSPERLAELKAELTKKGHTQVEYLTLDSELKSAMETATIIILATPPGSAAEASTLEVCKDSSKKILHLGGQTQDTYAFIDHPHFSSLTDLFLIEKEQSELRSKQVQQAIVACHTRSLLRSLSKSIHIAHGWEDLALFY